VKKIEPPPAPEPALLAAQPAPDAPPLASAYPPPPPGYGPPAYPPPGAAPPGAASRGMSPRVRRTLRWTAVALVFAVFGAGTAYAVTLPQRTHIPGLKTPADGRWQYPVLALPELPARKPRPLDDDRNPAGVHYADLRSLLVPLPEGAVEDARYPGTGGWMPPGTYLDDVRSGGDGSQRQLDLKENGLRHIAARAWTMPDGTRAEVYLLQFITGGYADLYAQGEEDKPVDGVTTDHRETTLDKIVPDGVDVTGYSETPPYGASMARFAYLTAGDTLAVVRLTRKGGTVPEQAYRQTLALQAQMLG